MTAEQSSQVVAVAQQLRAIHSEVGSADLLPPTDEFAVAACLAEMGFSSNERTQRLLALVPSDEIDGAGDLRLLRDLSHNHAVVTRLLAVGEMIDRVTILTLFYRRVSERLSTNAWRELASRRPDGRVRAAQVACEIVEAALQLRLFACDEINSLLDLQELSVDAQHLLESEANAYPAGPFSLPDGMHWVRHGSEAAQLMRSPKGREFFDYENMAAAYHTCYSRGTHFLGVNSDGVLFSFSWFKYSASPERD